MKISVVIMAYNRQNFIKQALTSCLEQTLPSEMYEIIVLKNFDYTPIIENKRGVSIRFIKYTNEKIGEMIIKGVEAATYNTISFLDDDDIFAPSKLELILKYFSENSELIFIRNNIQIFTNYLKIEKKEKKHMIKFFLDDLNKKSIFRAINIGGYLNTSSMSISKEIVLKRRSLIEKQEIGTDITLFYIALSEPRGKLMFTDEPLTFYRFHNSLSHLAVSQDEGYLLKLKETTLKNICSLKRIESFIEDSIIRDILSLSISSWKVQLSLISEEYIDYSTFIESLKFSLFRRKIIILFTTLISPFNNRFSKKYFTKLFVILDGYRMRNRKFL